MVPDSMFSNAFLSHSETYMTDFCKMGKSSMDLHLICQKNRRRVSTG